MPRKPLFTLILNWFPMYVLWVSKNNVVENLLLQDAHTVSHIPWMYFREVGSKVDSIHLLHQPLFYMQTCKVQ
jgi:hypothetical protein